MNSPSNPTPLPPPQRKPHFPDSFLHRRTVTDGMKVPGTARSDICGSRLCQIPFPFHWVLLRSKLQRSASEILLSLCPKQLPSLFLSPGNSVGVLLSVTRAYWVTLHRRLQLPPGLSPDSSLESRRHSGLPEERHYKPASQSQRGARSKCRTSFEIKQKSHSGGCQRTRRWRPGILSELLVSLSPLWEPVSSSEAGTHILPLPLLPESNGSQLSQCLRPFKIQFLMLR